MLEHCERIVVSDRSQELIVQLELKIESKRRCFATRPSSEFYPIDGTEAKIGCNVTQPDDSSRLPASARPQ
jgi:hypothetical protein